MIGATGHLDSTAVIAPDREADLPARIASGDRLAEQVFVARFEQGIRVLVRRHCRPGDPMVDDLVQDVLEQILRKLRAAELRDAGALPAYVRSTVVFMTAAEYRRRARKLEVQPLTEIDEQPASDDVAERFDSARLRELIRELLAGLPMARDRAILDAFYLRELDKDEVCARLGIDEPHFHRVISRARQRFGALLRDAGIEAAPK